MDLRTISPQVVGEGRGCRRTWGHPCSFAPPARAWGTQHCAILPARTPMFAGCWGSTGLRMLQGRRVAQGGGGGGAGAHHGHEMHDAGRVSGQRRGSAVRVLPLRPGRTSVHALHLAHPPVCASPPRPPGELCTSTLSCSPVRLRLLGSMVREEGAAAGSTTEGGRDRSRSGVQCRSKPWQTTTASAACLCTTSAAEIVIVTPRPPFPLQTQRGPRRRYADVVVHRLLAASLGIIQLPPQAQDRRSLRDLTANLNDRHRNAQFAGRASVELHTLIFFNNRSVTADARVVKVPRLRPPGW